MKYTLTLFSLLVALTNAGFAQTSKEPAALQKVAVDNKVDGSFTVEGKTRKLNYAYSFSGKVKGYGSDHLALVFSDRALTATDVECFFDSFCNDNVIQKARRGEFHAVTMVIDPNDKGTPSYKKMWYYEVYTDFGDGSFKWKSINTPKGQIDFTFSSARQGVAEGALESNLQAASVGIFGAKEIAVRHQLNFRFKVELHTDKWAGRFGAPPPTNLEPGRASGRLVVEGKTIRFNYVYSEITYNLIDEKKSVKLRFTDKPVSDFASVLPELKKAGVEYTVELQFVNNDPTSLLTYKLSAPAKVFSVNVAKWVELTSSDKNYVEGRFRSEGDTELDLAFKAPTGGDRDAPVTTATGKVLPVNGGEPGKAYLKIMKDLSAARSLAEVKQVLKSVCLADCEILRYIEQTEKEIQNNPRLNTIEKQRDAVLLLGTTDFRLTGGLMNQDHTKATLSFDFALQGSEVLGRTNMHFENGEWKLGQRQVKVTFNPARGNRQPARKPAIKRQPDEQ
jgi:hypothetical protein